MTAETAPHPGQTARASRMALDIAMFQGHAVNRSAAERRAVSLTQRRSVKKGLAGGMAAEYSAAST